MTSEKKPVVDEPLGEAVAECNAALEVCLELQRDVGDRDDLVATARDDLKRLARLLLVVERADVPFVMRQVAAPATASVRAPPGKPGPARSDGGDAVENGAGPLERIKP